MDGRKHPSQYAEQTYGGFSTGEWLGNTLKVTTTHMKTTFINRNGVPSYDAGLVGIPDRMRQYNRRESERQKRQLRRDLDGPDD